MNGLPICNETKAAKLIAVLVKIFAKKNCPVTAEDIEMIYDEDKNTTGQAFVTLKNDE